MSLGKGFWALGVVLVPKRDAQVLNIFDSSSFCSLRFVTQYAFYPPQSGVRGLTNGLPFIIWGLVLQKFWNYQIDLDPYLVYNIYVFLA